MRILRVVVIAALAAGLLAFLMRDAPSSATDRGSSAAEPRNSPQPSDNPEPSAALREALPAKVDAVVPAERVASTPPTAPPSPPSVPVPIGTEADWEREFAGKSREELLQAEKQLLAEFRAEVELEAERRFAAGEYEVYPQGEPPNEPVFGALFERGDELAVRRVNIHPVRDAKFFDKEVKAVWLREQARTRP